jgi:TIR domain-containing protein
MVFLSYSTSDARTAERIQHDLEQAGISVWRDKTRIETGDRLRDSVNSALRSADCIITLISSNSLRSKWVLNELDAAMLREIREGRTLVIPILIGRVKLEELPDDISGKLYLDLRNNFSKKYRLRKKILIRRIRSLTQPPAPNSRPYLLGDEAVAHILDTLFSDLAYKQLWQSKFINELFSGAFLPVAKTGDFKEGIQDFLDRYGPNVLKAVIAFYFRLYQLDVRRGVKVDDFHKVLEDAAWFAMVTSASWASLAHHLTAVEIFFEKDGPKYRARYFDRTAAAIQEKHNRVQKRASGKGNTGK